MPKISVIIICFNRRNELKECISSILKQAKYPDEIIVVDNNSTDGTDALLESGEIPSSSIIKYFKLDRNLGVAGGRNYGIKKASGDILVFIDDDAVFESDNAVNNVLKYFNNDEKLGVLAFKAINYYSRQPQFHEFPAKDFNRIDKEFESSYFVGCGFAARKEVFEKAGFFYDTYFYGPEEVDLGYSLLESGYKILFTPKIIIYHKNSPEFRFSGTLIYYTLRGRFILTIKNLPWRFVFVHLMIWNIYMLYTALLSNSISHYLRALKDGFILVPKLLHDRKKINRKIIKKIKNLGGRLYY